MKKHLDPLIPVELMDEDEEEEEQSCGGSQ